MQFDITVTIRVAVEDRDEALQIADRYGNMSTGYRSIGAVSFDVIALKEVQEDPCDIRIFLPLEDPYDEADRLYYEAN